MSSRLGCKDSPLGVEVAPLGSSWHDEERAARGVCETHAGAAVDQAAERSVAARTDHDKIQRRAVHRELLDRGSIRRVRLHPAERVDPLASLLSAASQSAITPDASSYGRSLSDLSPEGVCGARRRVPLFAQSGSRGGRLPDFPQKRIRRPV